MAYLDNSTEITIDATLTRKGREILASGQALNIRKFAVADDEIDYSLYDPAHPKGSAYYDSAILALPILEASVDETQMLKHKLVTMPRSTDRIPTLSVIGYVLTDFVKTASGDGDDMGEVEVTITSNPIGTNSTFTIILSDYEAGTVNSSIPPETRMVGSETRSVTYMITNNKFMFYPNRSLRRSLSTTITIIGNQTGASVTMPVVITYEAGN